MQQALHIRTTGLPGSNVKIVNQSLPERGPAEPTDLDFIINYDIEYRMGREG